VAPAAPRFDRFGRRHYSTGRASAARAHREQRLPLTNTIPRDADPLPVDNRTDGRAGPPATTSTSKTSIAMISQQFSSTPEQPWLLTKPVIDHAGLHGSLLLLAPGSERM